MSDFGLIKSFSIDGGQLSGMSAQECFVLGYELAEIDHLLLADGVIHRPVHADNRDRIEASCRESGRTFQLTWLPGDESESWLLLQVAKRA